jgi:hypothetical protein
MGEIEEEAMQQADQVFHFAVAGVHFGKTLSHLSHLASTRGPEACSDYPNVSLVRMELHKAHHFQYTVILDRRTGEEIESVSNLIRRKVQVEARHWLMTVEGTLCETQSSGVLHRLNEDDQRRLDRICLDISDLIASHVAVQDDEAMHNRLCPACLEKKALCEFVRCSSSAMDRVRSDRDAMTRLLQAISVFPGDTLVRALPSELTDFLFDESCPPELISVLPAAVTVRDIHCVVFANFLVEALRRLDSWKPPSESSVRFPSTVVAKANASPGDRLIPTTRWCHQAVSWTVRRWANSSRTGLDAAGVRIVRLISCVWGMYAAGAFESGIVNADTLHSIGEAYAGRAAAVREWAVQVLQPTLLRANLVDAKSLICSAVPEVEEDVDECISAFSNLALEEVLTVTSPESPLYRSNYWKVADRAASMMAVPLPSEFYRDFVRVILPMAVAHLGEKRLRRGISVSMRSSWIADVLFLEPVLTEIARVARDGGQIAPVVFVPNCKLRTSKGRKMLHALCDNPKCFVRAARLGKDRIKGFEVIVQDLLQTMYT